MSYELQAKLLRVLQERVITRVGGVKEISIDVRIVSATNANIHESIENGGFREDLYYRLNTIPVKIPALRQRREEIEAIANLTLKKVCKQYSLEVDGFSQDALSELNSYNWPGNIRELISVVERAAILCDNDVIKSEDLFLDSRNVSKNKSIDSMEKELIEEVLQSVNYDKVQAVKILGMSKSTFDKKIDKYNIR
jgi:DNA-binding NtrC family response regulator